MMSSWQEDNIALSRYRRKMDEMGKATERGKALRGLRNVWGQNRTKVEIKGGVITAFFTKFGRITTTAVELSPEEAGEFDTWLNEQIKKQDELATRLELEIAGGVQ